MADRPIVNPLPGDLPENWDLDQIVSPGGVETGLTEQHGYNYLMAQVNAAQRAVNAINGSFLSVVIGGAEPTAGEGPVLWFDTSVSQPEVRAATLELGETGAVGPVTVEVDETAYPVENATVDGEPRPGGYDFKIL